MAQPVKLETRMRLPVAAILLFVPALAHADPNGGALPFIAHDGGSFVDVRAAIGATAVEDDTRAAQAIDLSAQYMLDREVGVYGAFGATHASESYTDDLGTGKDIEHGAFSPLDIELGALLRLRNDYGAALTLTAGVSLPTVVNDPDVWQPGAPYFESTAPIDLVRGINRTAVRAAIEPSLRRGGFLLAGHAGVDVVPGAHDPVHLGFAGAIGGETDGGTSVVLGLGFAHQIRDQLYTRSLDVTVGLDAAHRWGRAQAYAGLRLGGSNSEYDVAAALVGGVRWSR